MSELQKHPYKQILEDIEQIKKDITALKSNAVTKKYVTANLSKAKWYRVVSFGSYSARGASIIVNVSSQYYYTDNSTFSVSVNLTHARAKITKISGLENTVDAVFDKIRVVRDATNAYVEIHYVATVSNSVTVEVLSNLDFVKTMNFEDTNDVTTMSELEL